MAWTACVGQWNIANKRQSPGNNSAANSRKGENIHTTSNDFHHTAVHDCDLFTAPRSATRTFQLAISASFCRSCSLNRDSERFLSADFFSFRTSGTVSRRLNRPYRPLVSRASISFFDIERYSFQGANMSTTCNSLGELLR